MLLLAHRGARLLAPESTLAAFDLALAHGAHGFEFDVRLTADSRLIICHNERIGRREVAGVPFVTLAESTAKSGRITRRIRPQLCCLEDVLTRYAAQAFLDIELKVAGVEESVVAKVRGFHATRGLIVSSFLPRVLRRMNALAPEIPLGYIVRHPELLPHWRRLPVAWVIPHWRLASAEAMRSFHAAGRRVLVWTVNTAPAMRRLAAEGADGLISDDPQLLVRTLAP